MLLGAVPHKIIAKFPKGIASVWGLAQALIHNPDVLILDEPTRASIPSRLSRRASDRAWPVNNHHSQHAHFAGSIGARANDHLINQGKLEAIDTRRTSLAPEGHETVYIDVEGPPAMSSRS